MNKNENSVTIAKPFFNNLLVPIATALIVGGTAPWWIELIKGDEFVNTKESSRIENVSGEPEATETLDYKSSIETQGSKGIVSDDSTVASDQAVVQQSYGSGSNISAGGDVHYNEAPESLKVVQESVALTLEKGMPYEKGRQILIEKGWQPLTPVSLGGLPDMNDPTISYIFKERRYQEVEACSGTGFGFLSLQFF